MKTYIFPIHINGIDGKPIGDESNGPINFNHFLANQLASTDDQKSGIDCIKIIDWARSIYEKGEITIDNSDRSSLEIWFKSMSNFSALIKVAFLDAIKPEN